MKLTAKVNLIQRASLIAATCLIASISSMQAQTLTSIDFTPLEGSAWGDSIVRLDFGAGMGMGTIAFSSINGGAFGNGLTPFPYNAAPYSVYNGSTTLGNGALFSPTAESAFSILSGSTTGLSGFSMTVTLDSGVFTAGSVFSVRSLGLNTSLNAFQYLSAVSGLGPPDTAQLPTDGLSNADWALIDASQSSYSQSLAGLTLYGAAADTGASRGLALEITGNSFTADFLITPNYQSFESGGMAFTIATAPVPEPSSAVFLGLGALFWLRRHRDNAKRPRVG